MVIDWMGHPPPASPERGGARERIIIV